MERKNTEKEVTELILSSSLHFNIGEYETFSVK